MLHTNRQMLITVPPSWWNLKLGILRDLHYELSVPSFPLYMLCLFICRSAVAAHLSLPFLVLTSITFLLLTIFSSLSFSKNPKENIFGFHTFQSKRHFMATILHMSSPLLIPHFFRTCHTFFHSVSALPHFLVLTSLSIRALRVLCTSSPNLSISAFKRSFCSVSSDTFLSFSCSLSLRLFLADKYDVEVRCVEEAKEDKAPLDLSPVLLLRFPRREDG